MEKSLNENNKNLIILFDSNFDISKLKKFNKNSIVISLDFDSHKILLKKNIEHITSDSFLTTENYFEIWKKSFLFSKWYENSTLEDILQYKNINLGKLFYIEFHYHLLPNLKKVIELDNICKKYKKYKIIAPSSLSSLLAQIHENIDYIEVEENLEDLLYNKIDFQLTKSLNLRISKDSYEKIKNLSDKVTSKLFNSKNKITKKQIMLAEFDIIKYKKLLELSSKNDIQFTLFNRRRPYIWNKSSYSVIKTSGCIISGEYDKEIKLKIKNNQNSFKKNIETIFNNEKFFDEFFTIRNVSFWNLIKPIFVELSKRRILDAIQEIEITDHVLKNSKVSAILLLSENGFNEQIILQISKKYDIETILLQHGMYWETLELKEGNTFLGGDFPILSDKFLVWGNETKRYVSECGFGEKTHVVGSTIYDSLFSELQIKTQGDYILLATSSPQQNEIFDLSIKNLEGYEKIIKEVCNISVKLKKKLIIKLHPFQEERDIQKIVSGFGENVTVVKDAKISELIKSCQIFLVNDFSTTMLDSLILEKPTIVIQTKNRHDEEKPTIFKSDCCIECNINTLEKNIKEILLNNSQNKMIENGQEFVKKYLSNQGNSTIAILEFLKTN